MNPIQFEITPSWVDAILAGVGLEALLLGALLRRASAERWIGPCLLTLASGAALLLALRGAVAGAGAPWIPLALLGALLAHTASLWQGRRALTAPLTGAVSDGARPE
jgi:hypothetical protein